MYQSVDENEDGETGKAAKETGRLKIIAALLVGMAILALVAIFSSSEKTVADPAIEADSEQYAIYTKALGEPHPALRRARLLDFVQNYPEHERKASAQAQLAVIQQADNKDWLSLQGIIFDPSQSQPAKLAALDLYEEMWGSVLLGSRESEVTELRDRLSQDPEQVEKTAENQEDFTPAPDKFDESIDGTQLAGGVVVVERTYIPPTTTVRPPVNVQPRSVIVKPKVRKDRRPKYPSKALRRGVEAEVILALSIDDEGEVQMTEVVSVRASKYRKDFIKASERAAMRTKYHPQTVDGKPVAVSGFFRKYVFEIQE